MWLKKDLYLFFTLPILRFKLYIMLRCCRPKWMCSPCLKAWPQYRNYNNKIQKCRMDDPCTPMNKMLIPIGIEYHKLTRISWCTMEHINESLLCKWSNSHTFFTFFFFFAWAWAMKPALTLKGVIAICGEGLPSTLSFKVKDLNETTWLLPEPASRHVVAQPF